ncbi:MAG: hypothetical protein ACOC35_12440 [Promethearchaeia archaeon]
MKTGSSLLIEDFELDTYYFWIIAYNKTGSVWSNVIMIEISLEELNDGGGEKPTPPRSVYDFYDYNRTSCGIFRIPSKS